MSGTLEPADLLVKKIVSILEGDNLGAHAGRRAKAKAVLKQLLVAHRQRIQLGFGHGGQQQLDQTGTTELFG